MVIRDISINVNLNYLDVDVRYLKLKPYILKQKQQ